MIGNSIAYLLSENEALSLNVMPVMLWDRFADQPLTIGVSIRPQRLTHNNILSTNNFTLSIPTAKHAAVLNYCGIVTGKEVDKFKTLKIETFTPNHFSLPVISDCLSYYDCKLIESHSYKSHTLFVAAVDHYIRTYENDIYLDETNTPIVYYDIGTAWWCMGKKVWDYTKNINLLMNILEVK